MLTEVLNLIFEMFFKLKSKTLTAIYYLSEIT